MTTTEDTRTWNVFEDKVNTEIIEAYPEESEGVNYDAYLSTEAAWAKATAANPSRITVTYYHGGEKVIYPTVTMEPTGVALVAGKFYVDANETVYRIKQARVSGNLYAESFTGESWEYAKGTVYHTETWHTMTAEEAATFGHETHKCVVCWRKLTDERSTSVGYGPVCADNQGWSWG